MVLRLVVLLLCFCGPWSVCSSTPVTPDMTADGGNAPDVSPAASRHSIVLYVATEGEATYSTYCGTAEAPCTLQAALDMAVPGTTIQLLPGVYYGEYVITTTVSIVGWNAESVEVRDRQNGLVSSHSANQAGATQATAAELSIFDGRYRQRPLTFDNVAAHVEHVHFRNGLGRNAGCVLVSRRAWHTAAEVNNFTHCSFANCTGFDHGDGDDDGDTALVLPRKSGAAGAVGVFYDASSGANHELHRVVMDGNYGRSTSSAAAGGLLVRYDTPSNVPRDRGVCTVLLLSVQSEALEAVAGTYRRVKGVQHAGRPVWKAVPAANVMLTPFASVGSITQGATTHVIAFCSETSAWAIVPISATMPVSKALTLNPPCTHAFLSSFPRHRSPAEIPSTPSGSSKWILSGGDAVEALRFQCQDSGVLYCSTLHLYQASGSQVHRNGVYYQLNVTRAGRPTFQKANDGDKPQFIWYCAGPREWIVSDDDPADATDTQSKCSRGIASLETLAMHPLLVPGWRYWDLELWRTSSGKHGLRITCSPTVEQSCPVLELVNGPMQDFFTGPYLITNFSWNYRPTYALRPPHVSFIWYCGPFTEWVVSETDPRTLDPHDERCSRALSSHPTQAPVPYDMPTRWAQFLDDEWVPTTAPVSLRCIDDCPRVVVDALGYAEGYKSFLGVYEAVGYLRVESTAGAAAAAEDEESVGEELRAMTTPSTHRIYRRIADGRMDAYLYYVPQRNCWVIGSSLPQFSVPQSTEDHRLPRGEITTPSETSLATAAPKDEAAKGSERHPLSTSSPASKFQESLLPSASEFAAACDGEPHKGVFYASNWISQTSGPSRRRPVDPQPTLSCDTHTNCRRVNVTSVVYTRQEYLLGVYEPLPQLHNQRPMYLHNITAQQNAHPSDPKLHYMYYCAPYLKWVVGPAPPHDGRCPAWIASKSTSSTHPLVNVHWVLTGDGVGWETSTVGVRMGCAAEDDSGSPTTPRGNNQRPSVASRRPSTPKAPSGKKPARREDGSGAYAVSDVLVDCNFTSNTATSDAGSPASGAVLLHYGATQLGNDPTGYIRRTSMERNEASGGVLNAGAVLYDNGYDSRPTTLTLSEVLISENRGQTGGLLASATRVSMNRVHLVKNHGFGNGGGLRLLRQANASGTTVSCRNNYAQRLGGCGHIDMSSSLSLLRSEMFNNSALEGDGTTFRGGTISVTDSRVLGVHGYAMSACFLLLSSSELSCASGTPASLTDGFGCLPDPHHAGGASSWRKVGAGQASSGGMTSIDGRDSGSAAGNGAVGGILTISADVVFAAALGAIATATFYYTKYHRRSTVSGKRGKRG